MNKKVLLSLMLIGVLAIGAGMGTYAWFSSSVKSNDNVFSVGTLTLDKNYEEHELFTTDTDSMQPNDIVNMAPFKIINTGTLDMRVKVYGNADISNLTLGVTGNEYMVLPMVNINGTPYTTGLDSYTCYTDNQGRNWITATDFITWLETQFSDYQLNSANPNKDIEIGGKVKLDKSAGNGYQDSELNLKLAVFAIQTDTDSTNTFPAEPTW